MRIFLCILFCGLLLNTPGAQSQNLYFPPINNALPWDTLSPASLGWCLNEIDSLYNFLQQENTKGFILLKDGKIVLEKYFGSFTVDSVWYWASAGKTITAFLTGKAQEEGLLSVSDTASTYLGSGWTNATAQEEANIKIIHQLTMSSGLDDGVPDNHCTLDTCLNYLANPGTRWAYHNAPYTLLEKVVSNASGQTFNAYTQSKLKTPTGMTGTWLSIDFDNIFFSKVRSMARFGLLIQNKGIWNNDTLLHDTLYFNSMLNTSQPLNLSYGYLWWLNGKASYMLPATQVIFPGSYAPDAPADMVAGLGKNGQIVSISKSKGLVMIRMGESPNSPQSGITSVFCNQIWQKLNSIMCTPNQVEESQLFTQNISIYPNPAREKIYIETGTQTPVQVEIFDLSGKRVLKSVNDSIIRVSTLLPGLYWVKVTNDKAVQIGKLVRE